jgi:rare lipoprotein A
MKHLRTYLLVILLLSITGSCLAQADSVQMGIASYYHPKFEGRKTSNGEIFRNDSLTAAHKKLPFGTLVKVTNLYNDSTVIVRINDRLPQNSKRSIDLSQAAAQKLNMMRSGIVKARIEILPATKKNLQLTDTVLVGTKKDTLMIQDSLKIQETAPLLRDTVIMHPSVTDNGYTHINFDVIKNGVTNVYQVTREPSAKTIYRKNGLIITRQEFQEATGSKL